MCVGGKLLKVAIPIGAMIAAPMLMGALGPAAGAAAGEAAAGGAMAGLGDIGMTGIVGLDAAQSGIGLGSMLTGAAGSSGMIDAASTLMSDFLPSGLTNQLTSPSFWGGQALNAAGSYMKDQAAQKQMDYWNNAVASNYAANKQLGEQGRQVLDNTLAGFSLDNQNNAYASAVSNRIAANDKNALGSQTVFLPESGSAPKEVKEAMATRLNDGLKYAREQSAAAATLGAAGDVNLKNNIALQDSGIKLGQLNNSAAGNNQVLGSQLASVQRQGFKENSIGDLLQGAGMMANAYSVKKANKSSIA